MYDSGDLLKSIKQIAINAVNATKPVSIVFGTVLSANPLKIKIEQKMILDSEQLILTRNVTNYKTNLNINMDTNLQTIFFDFSHVHDIDVETSLQENHIHKIQANTNRTALTQSQIHKHQINGVYEVTINNELKVDESVILIRIQEGQKYIVLDRLGV